MRSVSRGDVFQQVRLVILPVQTKSTADCLRGVRQLVFDLPVERE